MSETAAEDTSGGTGGVESRRVHLDLQGGLGRRRHEDIFPGSGDRLDIGRGNGGGGRAGVEDPVESEGPGGGGGVEEVGDQRVTRGLIGERHGRETERERSRRFSDDDQERLEREREIRNFSPKLSLPND